MSRSRRGLPKRVKVGHLTYNVEVVDAAEMDRHDIVGSTQHSTASIRVKAGMDPAYTAETLLHEIFHDIYDEWAVDKDDDEEHVVDRMSKGMATVMRDNPALVKWLMAALSAKR